MNKHVISAQICFLNIDNLSISISGIGLTSNTTPPDAKKASRISWALDSGWGKSELISNERNTTMVTVIVSDQDFLVVPRHDVDLMLLLRVQK